MKAIVVLIRVLIFVYLYLIRPDGSKSDVIDAFEKQTL